MQLCNKMTNIVVQVHNFICEQNDQRISILREKTVIQWIFGDLSFLSPIEKKNKTTDDQKYKILEDEWGREIMKTRRPDLKLDKQWTNRFGEYICEELCYLQNKSVCKPAKQNGMHPDLECDDCIMEAKCQTYYTSGTAGEKILGVPFKYADIPELYGKPLKIVCIGGAEKESREHYGNIAGEKTTANKRRLLDFFRESGIEYVAVTDILIKVSLISIA